MADVEQAPTPVADAAPATTEGELNHGLFS